MKKASTLFIALSLTMFAASAFTLPVAAVDEQCQVASPGTLGYLSCFLDKTVYGNVLVAHKGGCTQLSVSWTLVVDFPPLGPGADVEVEDAILYLGFHDLQAGERSVTFKHPAGTADLDDPYNFPAPPSPPGIGVVPFTARYLVAAFVQNVDFTYTVNVNVVGGQSWVYGAMLVVIYRWVGVVGAPRMRVMINDGCLCIWANEQDTTDFSGVLNGIPSEKVTEAKLITMVQGGQLDCTDELHFNTHVWNNPFDGFSSVDGTYAGLWDVDEFDVTSLLLNDNTVAFKDIDDGFTISVAMLIVKYAWWPVGGIVIPIDKLSLLAPYIGLASTILVATVATAVCVKRVKRRKERKFGRK